MLYSGEFLAEAAGLCEAHKPLTRDWYMRLATVLAQASHIREVVDRYDLEILEAKRRHEQEVARIQGEKAAVQNGCPHLLWGKSGDSSGGTDFEHRCICCGKEMADDA